MASDDNLHFDAERNRRVKNFEGWDKEKIFDYLVDWFHNLYADPAEETPYVEGEYLYVYGGPYDARDVLHDSFEGKLSDELIDEIANEITSDGTYEWAPGPNHPAQIAAAMEAIADIEEWLSQHDPLAILETAKHELEEFVADHVADEGTSFMHRMAFMQGWAILEAYLYSKLVKSVQENETAIEALYRANSDLKNHAFSGADLVNDPDLPRKTAITYLEKRSYHALSRVVPLFEAVFGKLSDAGADVDTAMGILGGLIPKRHDCIHRNGKTTKDETVHISKADIANVLNGGMALAVELDKLVTHYEAANNTLPF